MGFSLVVTDWFAQTSQHGNKIKASTHRELPRKFPRSKLLFCPNQRTLTL
jgi:hypothetical protein